MCFYKTRRSVTSLCTLFLLAVYGQAQQLVFFKPENLKQLPSSETYNIMQDSRGFIWFSTEGGLCKYNGDNIEVFDARNGLPEEGSYIVNEDRHGNIWIASSRNRILKYAAGKLYELPFTKEIAEQVTATQYVLSQMQWMNDSMLIVSSQRSNNLLVNVNSGEAQSLPVVKTDHDFYFKIFPNASYLVQPPLNREISQNALKAKVFTVCVMLDGKKVVTSFPYTKNYAPSWRCNVVRNELGETWIGIEDALLKIDPDGTSQVFSLPNTILTMRTDRANGLWLGLFNGGLRYYPSSKIENGISSLDGLSVTGICEDKEDGVWCTTLEKGVFYCRNRTVIDYTNKEEFTKVNFLKYIDGHLFLSYSKDQIIDIQKGRISMHSVFTGNQPVVDIVRANDGWLFSSARMIGGCDLRFKMKNEVLSSINTSTSVRSFCSKPTGEVYGISFGELLLVGERACKTLIRKNPTAGRCLLCTSENELLAGCRGGLYIFKDSSLQKIPEVSSTVVQMLESSKGQVWIVTKDDGVYLRKSGRIISLEKILPLRTKRFAGISEDRFGNIWLASNIGLIKITAFGSDYKAAYYNNQSGLPSNEIVHIATGDSTLYFSTPEGLYSFNIPEKLMNDAAPVLSLSELRVNGKLVSAKHTLSLPYNENTIRIKLNVFTYKRAGITPTLIYIVKGSNLTYQSVKANELVMNNLSPGNYAVIIYSVNNDGKLSTEPLRLNIEIQKPFWQTWLFIVPVCLLFLLLLYIVVRLIILRIRNKEKEKTRINKMLAEYHLSALRAQMNPHFIFNCINSIQRYILTKKSQEAYNYLTKFSRLIRLVLNYAEKNLITLSQELEIVELYTELEQLRFDNKFTYQFRIAGNVDPDVLRVPVLIVQPYIENAIWHGIMNLEKDKPGHISITILFENNVLKIIVEDNGVGRERAAAFSKKDHESKATWINNKRAEIINMAGSNVRNVTIEDVLAIDNTVAGTRVTILITQNNTETHE